MREALLPDSFLSFLHYSLDSADMATGFKLTAVVLALADQSKVQIDPMQRH